jgi:hypothetical protein
MHARAVSVDGDLRRAFGCASAVNGLANHEPPSHETGMFAGGDDGAFYASQQHQ